MEGCTETNTYLCVVVALSGSCSMAQKAERTDNWQITNKSKSGKQFKEKEKRAPVAKLISMNVANITQWWCENAPDSVFAGTTERKE